MANTRSAQKRNRQAHLRNTRNTVVKAAVRTAIKKARLAIAAGDAEKAQNAVRVATSALHKAASKGVLHKRNANRHVARLAHTVAEVAK